MFSFQSGEMDIVNHVTNENCHLKYDAYNYFGRDTPRKASIYINGGFPLVHTRTVLCHLGLVQTLYFPRAILKYFKRSCLIYCLKSEQLISTKFELGLIDPNSPLQIKEAKGEFTF